MTWILHRSKNQNHSSFICNEISRYCFKLLGFHRGRQVGRGGEREVGDKKGGRWEGRKEGRRKEGKGREEGKEGMVKG